MILLNLVKNLRNVISAQPKKPKAKSNPRRGARSAPASSVALSNDPGGAAGVVGEAAAGSSSVKKRRTSRDASALSTGGVGGDTAFSRRRASAVAAESDQWTLENFDDEPPQIGATNPADGSHREVLCARRDDGKLLRRHLNVVAGGNPLVAITMPRSPTRQNCG